MLTNKIIFKGFQVGKTNSKVKQKFLSIIKEKNSVLLSLSQNYIDTFSKKKLARFKKLTDFRVIGMGGSTLGTQAIYDFLRHKIKKKFIFVDNLQVNRKKEKKKFVNLIVSKSGNTIETISNANILIKKKDKNIFITENMN